MVILLGSFTVAIFSSFLSHFDLILNFIFTFISQGPFKLRSNTDQIQTTIADAKTTVATPAAAGLETQHVLGRYFFFLFSIFN